MTITSHRKIILQVLPIISIAKYENPLSKEARKSFDNDYEYYWQITVGWILWGVTFNFVYLTLKPKEE